ncbi:metallophosphoesterase [Phototrophicus methaneseepsis]|uniref:Metallophosphoesterase n=1 Tax=Phototrophicus methaneseepsis TaxID=2710758 RepID=A0A7S8E732_9CHLR|nr:metallophosphoesterase [Phototrophicus methaneseepsis]QPC81557.1 metallophosphoesterase [Phototrophicus methaneseepsis]
MSHPRAIDIDNGVAMVVTDLHGDGVAYTQIRQKFVELYQQGAVQYLILAGDMVHGYGPEEDDLSIPILLDIMRLQAHYKPGTVVMLLGNHEMPHIYSTTLAKGDIEFTPRFERLLTQSGQRTEILAFLRSLPFFVRTKAGVLINHSGAAPAINSVQIAEDILTFDHEALLRLAEDKIARNYTRAQLASNREYMAQARYFLGITGADDPRLTHFLRGQLISQMSQEFALLWDILFTRNELGWTLDAYSFVLDAYLRHISALSPYKQRVLVSGHIPVRGGYALIGKHQLRLASYTHANPHEEGAYLLLDCGQPITTAAQLVPFLRPTFSQPEKR